MTPSMAMVRLQFRLMVLEFCRAEGFFFLLSVILIDWRSGSQFLCPSDPCMCHVAVVKRLPPHHLSAYFQICLMVHESCRAEDIPFFTECNSHWLTIGFAIPLSFRSWYRIRSTMVLSPSWTSSAYVYQHRACSAMWRPCIFSDFIVWSFYIIEST